MALTAGTKLGPYEIVSPLGAGGMGEVYRARDTRLDRDVAIKVLPANLSSDACLRQRLEREAKAISKLSHPHICTLHDIGYHDGVDYLVMELVEGETLEHRLVKGPLPPEQTLRFAAQIADALAKAHKMGITHRDLKPSNIMLTKVGAKLMDFGLAKASGPAPLAAALTEMTADQAKLTVEGTIVGTFQYMTPEQLEGKEADARTDIFALGEVIYEMATSRPAFTGKSRASLIAAILSSEPQPMAALQPMTPPALERVVRRCLAKDPDERWQTASDLGSELNWIAEAGSQVGVAAPVAARRRTRELVAWILTGVLAAVLLALALTHFRELVAETRVVRSTILPPEKGSFVVLTATSAPALSPDGRNVAFIGRVAGVTQLWVRALDSLTPRPLAGTEDAYQLFWSPDSRNLGFFAQGKLKRVATAGGPTVTLCDVNQGRGGSWGPQDLIIFGKYPGEIYRVPASGGTPQQVTHFDPQRHDATHRWPFFLPDGNHFFYMASAFGTASEDNVVYLGSLDGVNRILFHGSSILVYGSGYLLYQVDRTLIARPFEASKLEFSGEPFAVAEGVQFDPNFSNGVFSASQNGTLLYQTGATLSARKIELLDRKGKPVGTLGEPAWYVGPRIAPDGKRVAYISIDAKSGKGDIWIQDIASGNRTRLTIDPAATGLQFFAFSARTNTPVWSRDGAKIAYFSIRSGKPVVYVKAVDGMGVEQKIWDPAIGGSPSDWTLDSKALIGVERSLATGRIHLVLVPADGKGQPAVLLELPTANVTSGQLSPDGRWIAYESDESGRIEIYVSSFPKPEGGLQISLAGGRLATWLWDGKELYYLAPDGNLVAAEVKESNGSLQVVARQTLFQTHAAFAADSYDVFPDGKKFLVDTVTAEETPAPLNLVLNWPAEFKK